jgi:hypothetical protein
MQAGNGNEGVITREDFVARHGVTAWEELAKPLLDKSRINEEQLPVFIHGIIRKFLEESQGSSASCLLELRSGNGACTPLYNSVISRIEEMIRAAVQ